MVKGLDVFRRHFEHHTDRYVLIGGVAATLAMEEAGLDFRATKDRRIAVKLVQPNVLTKEGSKMDFALNYELNLCRNGTPPSEGMDFGKEAKVLGN